jgi:hypothetical protein
MRVLATCVPEAGHLNPLRPLVEALLDQGDEVVIGTGVDPAGAIAGSRAEFSRAGHSVGDWFELLRSRVRGIPGDGLAPERINHYFIPRLFGEIGAADMIDDLLGCGRRFQPDIVLFEPYALAGPLVADILGVPGVNHLISPMLPHEVFELVDDAVSPLWRSFGRDTPGYAGVYSGTTIEVSPPSLEALEVPGGRRLPLRPAPLPIGERQTSKPPLVYVTMGTFFSSNLDVFRTVLDGLSAQPVDVIVTVGSEQEPTSLEPVPPNTKVERFVPQEDLLHRCSAVVHHGGSGTMFGSLAHGLPQVVIPQGADNFINGDLLVRAGAARVLLPGELTAPNVSDAIRSVLDDPDYTRAAANLAAEIAAMPGPDRVAGLLRSSRGLAFSWRDGGE